MFISFGCRKIRFHRCQQLSFYELSQTIDLYLELVTYINNRKTSTPSLFKLINQPVLSTKQSDNFFMTKIKRSERLMSINTFDKPESFVLRRLNSCEFSSIDPPPHPPFTSFRPPMLREKLHIVLLLNSDNSSVYTLSSY